MWGCDPVTHLHTNSGDKKEKIMNETSLWTSRPTGAGKESKYLGQTCWKSSCTLPFHLQDRNVGFDIFFCWVLICSETLVALLSVIAPVILSCLPWMQYSTYHAYSLYLAFNQQFPSPTCCSLGYFCLLSYSWQLAGMAIQFFPRNTFCVSPNACPLPPSGFVDCVLWQH